MATITKTLDNYTPPARPSGRKYNQGKIKASKTAHKVSVKISGTWIQQWASKGI
jgi:hypothetical protein